MSEPKSKIKLAILGVSWWTDMVWPGFSRVDDIEITAVYARSAEKAREFAESHNIPLWFDDLDLCVQSENIDAVYIGLPNYLHHSTAMLAMKHGKHVYQEKPMALSASDAFDQHRISNDNGLALIVNQELRLAQGLEDLPTLAAEKIGSLKKVVIGVTLAPNEWTGWRGDKNLSGGTLFEMIIHELDLARWLFGKDPISVSACGDDVAGKDLTVVLDFGYGDSALIDVCWRCIGFGIRVECYGDRGWIRREMELPGSEGRQTMVTSEGVAQSSFPADVQGIVTFQKMMTSFIQSVRTGSQPPITGFDGAWAVKMAEAARQSLQNEGNRIGLNDL